MADPITIIGSVGALCNIIEVVGKTISTISKICNQWKTADLAFLSLSSQLTALHRAMISIQEWMEAETDDVHHLLVMDLDVSTSCCKMLMARVDSLLRPLNHCPAQPLDTKSKGQFLRAARGLEEIEKLLTQQTSALTLLLTACNSKYLSEQKRILEKPKSRKVLARAKDSVSLFVHCDNASCGTTGTDKLSKLSMVFEFDAHLFRTRVYERALRNSLKVSLRQKESQQKQGPEVVQGTTQKFTQEVSLNMELSSLPTYGSRTAVILLGSDSEGKNEVLALAEEICPSRHQPTSTTPLRHGDVTRHYIDRFEMALINLPQEISLWGMPDFLPKYEVHILVFVVDLLNYSVPLCKDSCPKLKESLSLFARNVNIYEYTKSPVMVLFNNQKAFQRRFVTSRLRHPFTRSKSSQSFDEAIVYIDQCFQQVAAGPFRLFWCDSIDQFDLGSVWGLSTRILAPRENKTYPWLTGHEKDAHHNVKLPPSANRSTGWRHVT